MNGRSAVNTVCPAVAVIALRRIILESNVVTSSSESIQICPTAGDDGADV